IFLAAESDNTVAAVATADINLDLIQHDSRSDGSSSGRCAARGKQAIIAATRHYTRERAIATETKTRTRIKIRLKAKEGRGETLVIPAKRRRQGCHLADAPTGLLAPARWQFLNEVVNFPATGLDVIAHPVNQRAIAQILRHHALMCTSIIGRHAPLGLVI